MLLILPTTVNAELNATQNEEITVEVDIITVNINISTVKIKVTAPDGTSTTSSAAYNPKTGKWEIPYSATAQTGTYKATAIITDSDGNKHYSDETFFTIETHKVTITYRAGDFKADVSISTNATGGVHIVPNGEGFMVIDSEGNPVGNAKITTKDNITLTTDSNGNIIETDKFIDGMAEIFDYTKTNHTTPPEENVTKMALTVYTDGTITDEEGNVLEGVTIFNDHGTLQVKGLPNGTGWSTLNFVDMTYEEYKNKINIPEKYMGDKEEFGDITEIKIFDENGTVIGTIVLTPDVLKQIKGDKLIIRSDGTITDADGNIVSLKELDVILNNGKRLKITIDEKGKIDDKSLHVINDFLYVPNDIGNLSENKNLDDKKEKTDTIKDSSVIEKNKSIEDEKNRFHWYYLLLLLLIPLILLFVLKENKCVSDLEFLKEAQKQGKLKTLDKFNVVYVTIGTYAEVKEWNLKNIKRADAKDEIALATKLNIKKILTDNSDREKIARSMGFEVFNLEEIW